MKKRFLLRLVLMAQWIALAVLSVACNTTEDDVMSVSATIQGLIVPQTRVYNTSWQSGDAIGIFMESLRSGEPMADAYNLKYVTSRGDGHFDPVKGDEDLIYFPVSGIAVQLRAYYPYRETLDGTTTDPIYQIEDWSNQNDSVHFDLLMAIDQGSATDPAIHFVFKHACSRMLIDLEADETTGISNADLQGATIAISNMNRSVGYHLLNGQVNYGETLSTPIHVLMNADGRRGHAFLPPEEYGYFIAADRVVTIKLTNGTEFKWRIPSTQYFEANKSYPYRLKLNGYNQTVTMISDCPVIAFGGEISPQKNNEPNANGHEYVDLGLPSGMLWATCNLGAATETEYGRYYGWGETKGDGEEDLSNMNNYNYTGSYIKSIYPKDTYKFYISNYKYSKYNEEDKLLVLELVDDAAYANWGGSWRIPTYEDVRELLTETTNRWVINYLNSGINGRLFTSKVNNNTIFLPAGGSYMYPFNTGLHYNNVHGRYWTSTNPAKIEFIGGSYIYYHSNAWSLNFDKGGCSTLGSADVDGYARNEGYNIRPVIKL